MNEILKHITISTLIHRNRIKFLSARRELIEIVLNKTKTLGVKGLLFFLKKKYFLPIATKEA